MSYFAARCQPRSTVLHATPGEGSPTLCGKKWRVSEPSPFDPTHRLSCGLCARKARRDGDVDVILTCDHAPFNALIEMLEKALNEATAALTKIAHYPHHPPKAEDAARKALAALNDLFGKDAVSEQPAPAPTCACVNSDAQIACCNICRPPESDRSWITPVAYCESEQTAPTPTESQTDRTRAEGGMMGETKAQKIERQIRDDYGYGRRKPVAQVFKDVHFLLATIDLLRAEMPDPNAEAEPREGLCDWCHREYAPWFAPNDIWNRVTDGHPQTTNGVLPDHLFLCPSCFTNLAESKGLEVVWLVTPEPQPAKVLDEARQVVTLPPVGETEKKNAEPAQSGREE